MDTPTNTTITPEELEKQGWTLCSKMLPQSACENVNAYWHTGHTTNVTHVNKTQHIAWRRIQPVKVEPHWTIESNDSRTMLLFNGDTKGWTNSCGIWSSGSSFNHLIGGVVTRQHLDVVHIYANSCVGKTNLEVFTVVCDMLNALMPTIK